MLDANLLGIMSESFPTMNADVCGGLVRPQLRLCEQYLNNIWKCAAPTLPEGMTCLGVHKCTPYEEYKVITKPNTPLRTFELTQSNTYMVKVRFALKDPITGESIELKPRYFRLPYVGDGDIFFLKGTQYKVAPVLAPRAFNMERDKAYLRTPRAKITFSNVSTTYTHNGIVKHASACHSPLFIPKEKTNANKKHETTLLHYCLAEYGLTEYFKKFHGVDIKVGKAELSELSENGEYEVFGSLRRPPAGKRNGQYVPTDIQLAIPSAQYNKRMDGIFGAFFYITDLHTEIVEIEHLDNPELWLRLLARFIFKDPGSPNKVMEDMTKHRLAVHSYMDPITQRVLSMEGIKCQDTYELFHHMSMNFNDMDSFNDTGSMYNQELSSVEFIMYDIVYNIFTVLYELQNLTGDRITAKLINSIMDYKLRNDKITLLSKNGALSADSIASECKPFNATCNMVSQTKATAKRGKSKYSNEMQDPSNLLHPSQLEVATYLMMSKSEPFGREKTNVFAHFSSPGFITANPELVDTVEKFRTAITRI